MSDDKKIFGTIQAMIDAQVERDLTQPDSIKPSQIIIPDAMMKNVREFGKLITAANKPIDVASTGCDHPKQWGSLSVNGIKVFSSPHLPEDTMLIIDESRMKDPQPIGISHPHDPWHYTHSFVSMPPVVTFNPREPHDPGYDWRDRDFGALLRATHQTILGNDRGRFNVVICPDDSPFLPTHRSGRLRARCAMCAVCKMYVEMGCPHTQCLACEDAFRDLQARQHAKLRDFALRHFFAELHRRGKQWPTNQPLPEFLFNRRQSEDRKTLNASMKRKKRRQKIAHAKLLKSLC